MTAHPLWPPSLRLRILAPVAFVALPAVVLLLLVGFGQRQHVERGVSESAHRLASLKALHQERVIEGTRQLLTAISQSGDVRLRDSAACNAYLHELAPRFGATYSNLGVVAADGALICSAFSHAPGSLAGKPVFERALAARTFVVGEQIVMQSGDTALPLALPLLNAAGHVDLMAFATVDLHALNGALAANDWPADATFIVTDRHQTIVAMYPDGERWIGESLKNDPVTARMGHGLSGALEYQEGDAAEVVAFQRVHPLESGVTVRVLQLKGPAMAAANSAMYRMLGLFSLVALLVAVGAKVTADRLLLTPISQLTQASRRLAAGDLGARVAASTTIPELHELGKDFDAMAAALEDREAARRKAEGARKDMEQQYHQAQKMDAIGRLAGGIAHDFNNMLTAILGYCELLLEDPGVPERQRDDIREIEKAGKTAAQLTRQLLAFSRREIVEPAPLDLNTIVSGMDKMLHRLVGEHIRIETRLAADLWTIRADRTQMEQLVLNLSVNARDAMPGGGRMLIETANSHLPNGLVGPHLTASAGDYVMVAVTDCGEGIGPDVMGHLFEPFFTTKPTGKGTGLGLATVYGIVKQTGGGISVDSTPGVGAAFRLYFPRCEPLTVPKSAAQPALVPAKNGKATILVVEDDPGIRELTTRVLGRYGYDVLVADGGDQARRIGESHAGSIHLLLSDVVMPGMNGPMVADMLRKLRPALKVIFMSGYTDDAIVRHGVIERDVPFLQKPFTPERLANKIGEVLA